jgi:hypothetical protein
MNKNSDKSRLLSLFDRIGEAADFVNVDHLNLTNLSKPPIKDISKYSTKSDGSDYE